MAYVSKEVMQKAKDAIKAFNKKWNCKVSLRGLNTSKLTATVLSGDIDFITNFIDCVKDRPNFDEDTAKYLQLTQHLSCNHYYLDREFSGRALEFMEELNKILHADHWDESDIMTDYFSCAFYVSIQVGRWDKQYSLQK